VSLRGLSAAHSAAPSAGSGWSRVAIAAAAVLAFVGGYLAGHARDAATSFDAAWVTSATGSESAVQLLAVHRAPDPSALFASMLAN